MAVLIIVMSVMNGFRSELINKIVGFNAHVTVQPYTSIDNTKLNTQILKTISKNIIKTNQGEAIVINKNYTKGLILRGYKGGDFSKLDLIKQNNFIGSSTSLIDNYISIGKELSFDLNLKIGDKVTIMSPSSVRTIIGIFQNNKLL